MTDDTTTRDVVDVLTEDHHSVLNLIAEIPTTSDPAEKRAIADIVIAEIVRHSVAEEMHVYPAIRKHLPDGESKVEHDVQEHKELEATLKQLEGADASEPGFAELVSDVERQLRHHASEEEKTQFPELRQHLPAEELQRLGKQVELAEQIAPTRPHPSAPNAALFHKTVGPGVGMIDKLRDVLSRRPT
ncbi:MAG TPA: hemerythrin domain-containing protein [Jatrophihabitans sp.]|uniref:hemerythrin domain-containing protein n=1 Tax=Jatrophihabitans sp. TaxID=1932789 RepID=UPI002DFB8109|nr:hemerythrin domain-containing protein [Jatrophihabitans sp.]